MPRRRGHKIDEMDIKIMGALRSDGRKSNVEIAREVGVSEGTIRKRVGALVQGEVMQVVAVSNPQKLGYQIEVLINIHADIDKAKDIVDRLGAMEETHTVAICSGAADILVTAFFRNNEELLDFLLNRLGVVPGIRKTETSYVLRSTKRTCEWPVGAGLGVPSKKGEAVGRRRRRAKTPATT